MENTWIRRQDQAAVILVRHTQFRSFCLDEGKDDCQWLSSHQAQISDDVFETCVPSISYSGHLTEQAGCPYYGG